MTTDQFLEKGVFWIVAALCIVLGGFFTFLNLGEFVNISLFGNIDGYPFGGEGPVPYFYRSAQLYALINLSWGIIFLGAWIIGIRALIRRNLTQILFAFVLTSIFIILMLIHGSIGVD